jgi:hypothetical protein
MAVEDNTKDSESVPFKMDLKIGMPPSPGIAGVYDHEIDSLAAGEPIPLYLNFSIFLLSLSGSLLGSVIPTIVSFPTTHKVNIVIWLLLAVGIILFIIGIVLGFKWWKMSKQIETLAEQIKTRIKSD